MVLLNVVLLKYDIWGVFALPFPLVSYKWCGNDSFDRSATEKGERKKIERTNGWLHGKNWSPTSVKQTHRHSFYQTGNLQIFFWVRRWVGGWESGILFVQQTRFSRNPYLGQALYFGLDCAIGLWPTDSQIRRWTISFVPKRTAHHQNFVVVPYCIFLSETVSFQNIIVVRALNCKFGMEGV